MRVTPMECTSAGFGWSSCEKGDWYKKVMEKIPDLQVRQHA